jgi:hypothetical protein
MPKPRVQEFECLGIPLKANVFATYDRACSALCVPTKQQSSSQESGNSIASLSYIAHVSSADWRRRTTLRQSGWRWDESENQ